MRLPLIDNKTAFFFGEANAKTKRDLYEQARCLVIPLRWDEPFGLVLAEAMACGTPVVAFRRGAAPELIVDGETGFLVDDVDGMVEAVKRIHDISPLRCRSHVRKNFGPEQMAEGYLEIYADLAQRALPGRTIPALTSVGQTHSTLLGNPRHRCRLTDGRQAERRTQVLHTQGRGLQREDATDALCASSTSTG
jgi:hypothetical protein